MPRIYAVSDCENINLICAAIVIDSNNKINSTTALQTLVVSYAVLRRMRSWRKNGSKCAVQKKKYFEIKNKKRKTRIFIALKMKVSNFKFGFSFFKNSKHNLQNSVYFPGDFMFQILRNSCIC